MTSAANTGVKSNGASRSAPERPSFYLRAGKRGLDAAVSLTGLILLSPVIFAVAIAVKLTSHGPAFYRQFRVGQFGRTFRIVKFRSMVENADRAGPSITTYGDSRITGFGRWMRKTKIDEIPQFFNVFVGDMSLVGPRPEVPVYTATYTESQRRVFRQKPGITGPAASGYLCEEEILAGQKEARNFYVSNVLPRKLELDLRYCEDIRFANDIRMIFETVAKVIERSVRPQISLRHKRGSPL